MRRDHDGAGGNLIGSGAGCSSPFDLHRFCSTTELACAHKTRFAWQPLMDVCRKTSDLPVRPRERCQQKLATLFDRDQV